MRKVILFFLITILFNNANAQWNQQVSGTNNTLRDVYFVNSDTGFVVGRFGTFLKTINGGVNWNQITVCDSCDLESVFFTNDSIGYISGQYGSIFKTTDFGNNWTQLRNDPNPNSYILSLYFTSPDTGYGVYNRTIFKTTDGGNNWTSQTFNTADFNTIYFSTPMIGFAVGIYGTIYKTTDGGINWIDKTYGSGSSHSSVFFTDSITGYIVGHFGGSGMPWYTLILKTIDGGNSFVSQYWSSPIWGFEDVFFINQDTGYVLGGTVGLRKTIDGGANWFQVNIPIAGLSIFFVNSNIGYAVGHNGGIVKTNNAIIDNINEYKDDLINVFPNPTKNQLTINHKKDIDRITIINLNGETIKTITSNINVIDISDLSNGIYFIRVTTDKGTITQKFVKQ